MAERGGVVCEFDGKRMPEVWVELVTRVAYGEGGNGGVVARKVLPFCDEECVQRYLVTGFPFEIEKAAETILGRMDRELRKERPEDRAPMTWETLKGLRDDFQGLVTAAREHRDGFRVTPVVTEDQARLIRMTIRSMYRLEPASVDPESPATMRCAICGKDADRSDEGHSPTCLTGKLEEVFGAPPPLEIRAALDETLGKGDGEFQMTAVVRTPLSPAPHQTEEGPEARESEVCGGPYGTCVLVKGHPAAHRTAEDVGG